MRIDNFSFGSIQIDGRTYAHDVIIDRGQIRKRRKGASKRHRESYGHTVSMASSGRKAHSQTRLTSMFSRLPLRPPIRSPS